MDEKKQASCIRIASTINWVLGIVYILVFISVLIPSLISKKNNLTSFLPLFLMMGLTFCIYCLSGWGLRKLFRWAGILSLCFSGLSFIVSLLYISRGLNSLISLVISGSIIALIIAGWRALK